jgi:hypothetical protein
MPSVRRHLKVLAILLENLYHDAPGRCEKGGKITKPAR